jgi:hypothetical protein
MKGSATQTHRSHRHPHTEAMSRPETEHQRATGLEPPQGGEVHHQIYTPNHISLDTRAGYLIASSLIVAYAIGSLMRDDFYIWLPARRGRDLSEHLHGSAAWLAAGAAFAAASNLLAVVVDHYDKRNNETNYRAYAKWSLALAAVLLVLAFIAHGINRRYSA